MSRASHQKLPPLRPPVRLARGLEWPAAYADDVAEMQRLHAEAEAATKALRDLETSQRSEIAGRIEEAAARRRAGRRVDPQDIFNVDARLREARVAAEIAIAASNSARSDLIARVGKDEKWRKARLDAVRVAQVQVAEAVAAMVAEVEAFHVATIGAEWSPVSEAGTTDVDDSARLARAAGDLARIAAELTSRDPDRRHREWTARREARESAAAEAERLNAARQHARRQAVGR